MAENGSLHLCAGSFLALLYHCRRPVYSQKGQWDDEESELTQNEIALRLTRLVLESESAFPQPKPSTLTTHVSRLINCKTDKPGSSTPYYTPAYRSALQNALKTDYKGFLLKWNDFLDRVLDLSGNPGIPQFFVYRLLAAIEADDDFVEYYSNLHQRITPREALLNTPPQLMIQTFTLDIWAWICEEAPSCNMDADTLNSWLNSTDTAERAVIHVFTKERLNRISIVPAVAEKKAAANEAYAVKPVSIKQAEKKSVPERAQPHQMNTTINNPGQNPQDTSTSQVTAFQSRDSSKYHIFVGLCDTRERKGYFMVPKDRALTEYTDDDFTAQFLPLTKDGIQILKQYPAVFMDELQMNSYLAGDMPAYLGILTEIKALSTGVKVYYSLNSTFLANDIVPIMDELDLHSASRNYPIYGELTRTHWALKDVDLYEVLEKHRVQVTPLPEPVQQ